MEDLAPGTLVKSLFTDRDTLEQEWDYGTVGVSREEHPGGWKVFIAWKEHIGFMMWPDEVEVLGEEEKLAMLVMKT